MLSESKFLEIYRRQQESGLTVKDFCSNEGIADSTFYYWYKKVRKKSSKQDFIPLVVKTSPSHLTPKHSETRPSVEDSLEMDDVLLEVVYPNGTRLRIKKDIDLTQLRALVCLFE
jgi:transposase-like protein